MQVDAKVGDFAWFWTVLAGLVALAAAPAEATDELASIELDAPVVDAVRPDALAYLSGRVPLFAEGATLDLVLAVDTSDSTDIEFRPPGGPARSLAGRFRDWLLPPPTSVADTLLGLEIQLARDLLARLDPRTTRVGVVAFAGDLDPELSDATTVQRLTDDFDRIRAALSMLEARGSKGFTDIGAGVDRALGELMVTPSARSTARADSHRAIVVLTDAAEPDLIDALARRIARAKRAEVTLDVVVVGEEAERSLAGLLREVPRAGGRVLRCADREDAEVMKSLQFASTRGLRIENQTLGLEASALSLSPDGGFAGLVKLAPGTNQIEIRATLDADDELVRSFQVQLAEAVEPARLSARDRARRARLFHEHLRTNRRRTLHVEPEGPSEP